MLYRPAGVTQAITTSGTSAQTASAISEQVYVASITASEDAYIVFGTNPTATSANGIFLLKDWPTDFSVRPGEKVAAIQVSAGGTVYVSELTR
jgi:hypothetical protein|tara:strand:- start:2246 stop:2524 length:279 start_codon:yes stop_codon:yes gene_type:complete